MINTTNTHKHTPSAFHGLLGSPSNNLVLNHLPFNEVKAAAVKTSLPGPLTSTDLTGLLSEGSRLVRVAYQSSYSHRLFTDTLTRRRASPNWNIRVESGMCLGVASRLCSCLQPYQWKKLEHLKIRLNDIELATKNFSDKYLIGSGAFGMVYKARLEHFDSSNSSSIDGENKCGFSKKKLSTVEEDDEQLMKW